MRKQMGFSEVNEEKMVMVVRQQKQSGWVYAEADNHKYQKAIEKSGNEGGDKGLSTKYI